MRCPECGFDNRKETRRCEQCHVPLREFDASVKVPTFLTESSPLTAAPTRIEELEPIEPDFGSRYAIETEARFGLQFSAAWLDGLVIAALLGCLLVLCSTLKGETFGTVVYVCLSLPLVWLYFSLLESSPWMATPGQRAAGIIVVDENWERLTFQLASERTLVRMASYMTLGLWYLAMMAIPPWRRSVLAITTRIHVIPRSDWLVTEQTSQFHEIAEPPDDHPVGGGGTVMRQPRPLPQRAAGTSVAGSLLALCRTTE